MGNERSTSAPFKMTPLVFHVLLCMTEADIHAYGMMKEIQERTGGALKVGPGSLHFTLSKLLGAGMIEESGARPDENLDDARRRYFRLTDPGREILSAEAGALAEIVALARLKKLIPRVTG